MGQLGLGGGGGVGGGVGKQPRSDPEESCSTCHYRIDFLSSTTRTYMFVGHHLPGRHPPHSNMPCMMLLVWHASQCYTFLPVEKVQGQTWLVWFQHKPGILDQGQDQVRPTYNIAQGTTPRKLTSTQFIAVVSTGTRFRLTRSRASSCLASFEVFRTRIFNPFFSCALLRTRSSQ